MCKILHVSDFHVNLNYTKSSERLEKLTRFLENENIKVDYLVFTGDIIHAGVIADKCKKSISKQHALSEKDWENVLIRPLSSRQFK